MSLDPAPPSASESSPVTPPPDLELAKIKRRYKKESDQAQDEPHPERAVQLLSTLLVDLMYGKSKAIAPSDDPRGAKYHRVTKSGVAQDSGVPAVAGTSAIVSDIAASTTDASSAVSAAAAPTATPSDSAATSGVVAPAPTPAAIPASAGGITTSSSIRFRPAPPLKSAEQKRGEQRVRQFYLLVILILVMGGAYYTYKVVPKSTPANEAVSKGAQVTPPPALLWTDGMIAQLDQSLASASSGDIDAAEQQAEELLKSDGGVPPGLDIYLALLRARSGHVNDSEASLLNLLDTGGTALPPLRSAAVRDALAFVFSRKRDFPSAAQAFGNSVKADPFSPTVYYHWGDLLRHQGNFQQAEVKFGQVLDRIPVGEPEMESLRQCTELKMHLSRIEAGQDGAVETEVQTHLSAVPVSGYWLLTAAAVALQRRDFPRALDFLHQSKAALDQAQFDALMNDYFFRGFSDQKELAEFYTTDPKARRVQLRSTGAYMIEP